MTAPAVPSFPVDDSTLDLVWTAIHPPEGATQSSLFTVLDIISDLTFGEVQPDDIEQLDGGVTFCTRLRWSEHDLISALVTEVRRLRQN